MQIRTHADLTDLASDVSSLEQFGPNTPNPILCFDLTHSLEKRVLSFLRHLPCPVIGIGHGEAELACDIVLRNTKHIALLSKNTSAYPFTSMILVQHLRASENLNKEHALIAESLAFSALQNGPEFKRWLATQAPASQSKHHETFLIVERTDETLKITLNRPKERNAIDTTMRDALCEALNIALIDPSITSIQVTGAGTTFSTGGDVAEFGSVSDPTTAHWIRMLRQPATRLIQLQDKLNIHINGPAIGAGLEMAAFGENVTASAKVWFQLPELKFGLIPGAGGTVSLPRRIGRQNTAFMALSMKRIRAETALEWGLIDAIKNH